MTRKDTILSSAAKLFRKRGFQATSMRDIAKEVGMEAPSLYNHIKSKDELLSILLMDVAHDFVKGMEEVKAKHHDTITVLKEIINLHIKIAIQKTNQISLITDEWRHLNDEDKEQFLMLRQSYEDDFVDILKTGIEKKVIKNVDVSIALFSILSTLRWFYAWYSANPTMEQNELESQFHSLLLDGILDKS